VGEREKVPRPHGGWRGFALAALLSCGKKNGGSATGSVKPALDVNGGIAPASATLPRGPFLAYDRAGRLLSTIYMIPLKSFETHMPVAGLAAPGGAVDHVDIAYQAGHPGVEEPHYHIILWHVSRAAAARAGR